MISFRLSGSLLARIDFITGNTPDDAMAKRSAVLTAAIEAWLPAAEDAVRGHLKEIGAAFPERK